MDQWLRRFQATLHEEKLLGDATERVLIGVSGGPDSICLLDLFVRWCEAESVPERPELLVGHVHHGLRGAEADADAELVEARAAAYGVEFVFAAGDAAQLGREHGLSLEAAARDLRYSTFRRWAEEKQLAAIALAHHLDDQAETVLLRAIRGSGVKGMGAMAPARPLSAHTTKPHLIRPLLDWRRQDILEYLQERALLARSDATNDDRAVPRNLIRHEVLPRLEKAQPGAAQSLAQFSTVARELQSDLEEFARTIVQGSGLERGADSVAVNARGFDIYPESLLREIVLALFAESHSCEAATARSRSSVAPRVPRTIVRELRGCLLSRPEDSSQWDLSDTVRMELRYGKIWLRYRQTETPVLPVVSFDAADLQWSDWDFSLAAVRSPDIDEYARTLTSELVATFDADVLRSTGGLTVRVGAKATTTLG